MQDQSPDLALTLIRDEGASHEIYDSFRSVEVPRNPFRAAARLKREDFDVLHAAPPTIFTPFWSGNAGRVATIHSLEALQIPEDYRITRRMHDRTALRSFSRMADRVVTVSEYSKRDIVDLFRIDPDRIAVTYNGVSPAFRRYNARERTEAQHRLRTEHGVDGSFILHVSNFRPRKNPQLLLAACRRVLDAEDEDRRLVVVGAGWKSRDAQGMIHTAGLTNRVIAVDFVPEERLVDFFNCADVFVFPSLYEGFGMPNVEAMACGCPVITSNGGAIPEIVGDAAIRLDTSTSPDTWADAIRSVITSPNTREGLANKGLDRARKFSWKTSALALADIYRDVADVKGNR